MEEQNLRAHREKNEIIFEKIQNKNRKQKLSLEQKYHLRETTASSAQTTKHVNLPNLLQLMYQLVCTGWAKKPGQFQKFVPPVRY